MIHQQLLCYVLNSATFSYVYDALMIDSVTDQEPDGDIEINTTNNEETDYSTLFFMLGNACMLPYGALVNGIDIFARVCRICDAGDIISLSFNTSSAVIGIICCIFRLFNLKLSILISLSSLLILMFLLSSFIIAQPSGVNMSTIIKVVGIFSGVFSSLLFTNSSILAFRFDKSKFMVFISGYSISGVITSALRIITKGSLTEDHQQMASSASYLMISSLVILVALIIFLVKLRTRFFASRINDDVSFCFTSIISRDTVRVLKVVWGQSLVLFVNTLFTFCLFPGFMSHVQEDLELGDWTIVIVTGMFFIFSWIGDFCPSKILVVKPRWTWLLLIVRFWFLPLFVAPIRRWVNLGDPLWTFCWMIPFAVTHGYTNAITIRYSMSYSEIGASEKKLAMLILFLCMYCGLACAMCAAFGLHDNK